MKVEKLKRAVIKEEYIAITGDFTKAVILNQFVYWSERISDFDYFIAQENERARKHGVEEQDYTFGWIYKSAEELSQETMLGLSVAGIRSHIKTLVEQGFLSERNNPKYKWDRTKQYRVNLVEIATALEKNGYSFDGYRTDVRFLENKNGKEENKNQCGENSSAIPETTTDTTSETTTGNIYIAKPTEVQTEFETLWKMYPRKLGKPKALKAYTKARKNGATFEQVKKGIENYCKQISVTKTKPEYIKHGSTWFGNECWNDEYETGGSMNGQANGNTEQTERPAWSGTWL